MTPRGRARWRIWVHALDRTGPPVLARSVLRWLAAHRPDLDLEVLAFRGGELEAEVAALAALTVVLDDEEAWDPDDLDRPRVAELRDRLARVEPVALNLLVSVSAGQPLPLLPVELGPVATWSVEVGEDLHWLDRPIALRERTHLWLAGSEATASELALRLGDAPVVIPEMIDDPVAPDPARIRSLRREAGVGPREQMVLGAGIGTHRKGIDLFVEAALAHRRAGHPAARFVWIGGVRDELHPRVRADLRRLDIDHVELVDPVPDIEPWCAAADVFLHTARLDAFPLVCLHAAAVGTPVVAFLERTGVREMFGGDALGARYPDLPALVGEVARLADPTLAAAAGARQRDRIAGRHLASAALPVLLDALAPLAAPDEERPR